MTSLRRTTDKKPPRDRSKRLLDLVMTLLRSRIPVTFQQLKIQFSTYQTANIQSGLRSFERDKADLLELGIPLRYITPEEDDSLEEGGYVIELTKYSLPEVHLTAEEMSALLVSSSVAHAAPGGQYPKIVDLAVQKLAFDFSAIADSHGANNGILTTEVTKSNKPSVLVQFPSSSQPKDKLDAERFQALEDATSRRKKISLTYQSPTATQPNTTTSHRVIYPYGLVYREGAWLLVAHCTLREAIRSFRLDRILDYKVAPKPKTPDFERPLDFDIRNYANASPWTFHSNPPIPIEFQISPTASDILNEDFGHNAVVRSQNDGTSFVSFACTNLDFAVSRILSAKGAITVRKGDALKDRLRSEITTIQSRYL